MKNKTKHTPGPWRANYYALTNKCFVATSEDTVIFEENTEATNSISPNAHLISAAPEMLEALEKALIMLDETCDPKNRPAEYSIIKQAIKKAKGVE